MEYSEVTAVIERYVETLREEFDRQLADVRSDLELEIANLGEELRDQ
jgi:hypothetical protein